MIIHSVQKLLCTLTFLGNQTRLAKFLHIDRRTLRNHLHDLDNKNHVIIQVDDKFTFMATNKSAEHHRHINRGTIMNINHEKWAVEQAEYNDEEKLTIAANAGKIPLNEIVKLINKVCDEGVVRTASKVQKFGNKLGYKFKVVVAA